MDIIEAIRTRKSIRDFKPDAVPQEILRQILETASHAPSAMNTQPWEFIVLTGDILKTVKQANVEMLNAGTPPHPEHLVVGWSSDSVYRQRQVELAIQIFQLMDISREDKEKRARWMERGFRYFDAPAALILLTDKSLTEAGPLLDIGAVMQNICLAALHFGLGTCIEDQGVLYPDVLRKLVGIPESKRIIIALAIGYPNEDFPANRLESSRESIDTITSWYGFE
ncbi:MAG: nitroreductase [Thermodesulfobacteriota bacterium]|nr:nitroreductase [Thermodesulfobacteriota bacterium]